MAAWRKLSLNSAATRERDKNSALPSELSGGRVHGDCEAHGSMDAEARRPRVQAGLVCWVRCESLKGLLSEFLMLGGEWGPACE